MSQYMLHLYNAHVEIRAGEQVSLCLLLQIQLCIVYPTSCFDILLIFSEYSQKLMTECDNK